MTSDEENVARAIQDRQGCRAPMYCPGWEPMMAALSYAIDDRERRV